MIAEENVAKKIHAYGRTYAIFVLLSLCGMLFVYRGAVWNEALLAPLDLPAELYSKFRWMDPAADGIPKNHYIIDIFDFELPRHYIAYHALRRGEFPWWDPYTHGGRPLAVEAHVSFTDPLRLSLYSSLPFETAYNYIRLLHSFLLGTGAFLLLRHLRYPPFVTLFGALSFQFASPHFLFFFPAHLQATFLYYPFLWMLWSLWMERPRLAYIAGAAVCCAGIILAGHVQSHAYLVIFALCFCLGYGWFSPQQWKRVLTVTLLSGLVGAALAFPVLASQIELYLLSYREIASPFRLESALAGPLSLSFFFPWATGTFRTLDIGKIADQTALGFALYLGTGASILAVVGLFGGFRRQARTPALRTASLLIFTYLVAICCSPLLALLYARASGLAVLGLLVCAAHGLTLLLEQANDPTLRFVRYAVGVLALALVLLNVAVFAIYPSIKDRVRAVVLEKEATNLFTDRASALRVFQVENLSNEVTIKNPETWIAFLSGAVLLLLFRPNPIGRPVFLALLLLFNILPLLFFAERFIPKEPVARWRSVLEGGPEQKKLKGLLTPGGLRMNEQAPGRHEFLFPGCTAMLYGVRTLSGYSAFFMHASKTGAVQRAANYLYRSGERGLSEGELKVENPNANLRFVWQDPQDRAVKIVSESLNTIVVAIAAGSPGTLLRTDTYYPGWELFQAKGLELRLHNNGFYAVDLPGEETTLTFRYRPVWLKRGLVISAFAGVLCLGMTGASALSRRSAKF